MVSFVASRDGGVAAASTSGSATHGRRGRRARRGRRRRGPGRLAAAEDADPLVRDRPSPTGTSPRCPPTSTSTTTFAPALGEAFGRAGAGGRLLYGFVDHERHHDLPRLHHRAAPASRPADRPLSRCTGKDRATARRSAWVGGGHPRLHRRRRPGARHDAGAAARPGAQRQRRPPGGPLRHDPAAHRRGRPDGRRLLVRRRPRRPRGPVGLQPARRTGTRIGEQIARDRASTCSPIRPTRPRVRAVRDGGDLGQRGARSSTTASRWRRTDWIADGGSRPSIQTRHTAAMTEQPSTPYVDNLVLEVDGGRRRHRGPRRRHRARPAADLPVVHPRGRPAGAAAHRPDP